MCEGLRARGFRLTPQRLAIVRLFAEDCSHPTAQDLFARLRPAFPTMSFATVYNTLDALAQAGLSSSLRLGALSGLGAATRFDPNTEPHHHAVCDRCGVVVDLPVESLAAPQVDARHVDKSQGFRVRAVETIYRGTCAGCRDRPSLPPLPNVTPEA
jgi:Fe2+ or Zn2+ uptake regulation protein